MLGMAGKLTHKMKSKQTLRKSPNDKQTEIGGKSELTKGMETEKVISEAEELPKAIVRRVVKDTLTRLSTNGDGGGGDFNLHKDALLAFSESARIFIHYLSATANDICKESKRQTINADDVFKALEEIEFPEFVEPLRSSLNEFRKKNSGKRAGASETKEMKKKTKVEEEPSKKSGGKNGKK